MPSRRTVRALCLIASFPLLLAPVAFSQLVMGQYEEEAPFRTWNTFPLGSAACLGRGETSWTIVSDTSAALANPGLLPFFPKFMVTVGGSYQSAAFFKYGPVNTGVLMTTENVDLGLYGLDLGGLALRLGPWAIAVNAALIEEYDRPTAKYEYSYRGSLLYSLSFEQTGYLRNIQIGLGRRIGRLFGFGLGLNFISGHLEREVIEQYIGPTYTITDDKTYDFRGIFLNGGFVADISDRLRAAAVFRLPYFKKSDSHSLLSYVAPAGNTDISIDASVEDSVRQPLVLGAGLSYAFWDRLRLALDASYYFWSEYQYQTFGEAVDHAFRNIVKIGLGGEYCPAFKLFGQSAGLPIRVGIVYDPQPMKTPVSSYVYFTLGIGLQWRGLFVDAGALAGRESGSGNDLTAKKFAVSLGWRL
jgi:hypothetical protein